MKQKSLLFIVFLLFFNASSIYSVPFDCEVLKHITRIEYKEGKLIQIDTIVFKVNNRNGERYTDFSVPYSKIEKVLDINGWIVDSSGKKVRSLKSSDIVDQSWISGSVMYSDFYLKTFHLRHNSYPYKVYCTSKSVTNQFIAIAKWSPIIDFNIPTLDARLFITVPKDYQFKLFIRKATQLNTDTTNKRCSTYMFTSSYNQITTYQLFAEPFKNNMPLVVVIPNQFFYGVDGSSKSWVDYGNWILGLNKGLLGLPESEEQTINELLKGVTDTKEKVKRLYYYLQDNTRYINVSIGVGGHQSYPASYVAQNKYGDCKALTNYMMALLNYAGIKSYYTLINGSFQPEKLNEDLPFPQFNHIILCVPFEKDTLWLENTSSTEPFGYISSFIQNRKVLFIDENSSHLIDMPKIDIHSSLQSRKINIAISSNGDGEFQSKSQYTGYYFELYNQLKTSFNKDEQDRFVREIMPSVNCEIKSWKLEKHQRDSALIGLSASFTIGKFIEPLGSDFYFSLIRILKYSFELPNERKSSLQIPVPINCKDTTIYSLPQDLVVKSLPDSASISNQFGKYKLKVVNNGKSISVYKELLIYSSFYPLDQYKTFFDFIKLIKDAEKKVIVLSKRNSNV